jgi:MuDR family transposase
MSNMNTVLPQLAVDTEFTTLDMLKHACHAVAIQDNFEFSTVYSEQRRYSIKCKAEGCPWRLYAAPIFNGSTQFRIRIFNNEHICFGLNHCGHEQATASFISKKIHEKIQEQPTYRPSDIKNDIRREHVENRFRKTSKWERTGRNASQTIMVWRGESTISMGWNNARAKPNGRKSQQDQDFLVERYRL